MEQGDGVTSSNYIDSVTIHKRYIRRAWIYYTIPLHCPP